MTGSERSKILQRLETKSATPGDDAGHQPEEFWKMPPDYEHDISAHLRTTANSLRRALERNLERDDHVGPDLGLAICRTIRRLERITLRVAAAEAWKGR